MTKAEPASETSCMLQEIGSVQNHMNIRSEPLSLTNTISPALILSTPLRLFTARGLILSYLQIKIFMLFISASLSLESSTSLDAVILKSPVTRTYVEYPNKSRYWLQKHVESKHLSTQLVHVFTELRTETLKRSFVSIYRSTSFSLNFLAFEIKIRHIHNKPQIREKIGRDLFLDTVRTCYWKKCQ
jgi:hypothetical protein